MARTLEWQGERQESQGALYYKLAGPQGSKGSLSIARLLDGINLAVYDLRGSHFGGIRGIGETGQKNYLCHCRRGSFESPNKAQIDIGDIFTSQQAISELTFNMPKLGYYGVEIGINPDRFNARTRRLLADFDLMDDKIMCLCGDTAICPLSESASMSHLFSELYDLLPSAKRGQLLLKVIEILQAFSTQRNQLQLRDVATQSKKTSSHAELAFRAQKLMMEHLEQPLTINDLSERCSTSPTVLKESFRETFGQPIYQWYRHYRAQQAAELLSTTELPVNDIARAVGYSNPSKFSKAFNDCLGMTPRNYRKYIKASS
ncbi:MAG: helix-turn-helix transcriptional regulator [Atopobiaceae bacterium]|nr:helix-turn-helix transcriptional regulator [Atopobiaceae bacterium]